MPVTIECPYCDAHLDAPDNIEGKKVRCKNCAEKFRVNAGMLIHEEEILLPTQPSQPAKSATKSRPPAVVEDEGEEEDEGKRRSRPPAALDDEEKEERSSRRTEKKSGRRERIEEADDEEETEPRRRSQNIDDDADEPQRKKKKRKRRRRSGNPVVVFGFIGIGALVLIGILGAIFSGGGKLDGLATAGGSAAGPGGAGGGDGDSPAGDQALPGWMQFSDPNGQFKVRMPRIPAAPAKQHWPVTNGDPAEATIYTVEIGGGTYSMASLTVPGRDAKASADPLLDDAIGGGMGWFKGATIKSRSNVTHQTFSGRQAVLEYPGVKGTSVVRVIVAGSRMYWLMAKGDNFSDETPKVRAFFDSLKIN